MKSYKVSLSLFLLVSLQVTSLTAKLMDRGIVYTDPAGLAGKKLFKEFKDLDKETFQKRFEAASPTDDQIEVLLDMFIDHGEGSRDLNDKILFLAGKVEDKKGYTLLWAYDKGDQSMITKLRALGYTVSSALRAAIIAGETRFIAPLIKDVSIDRPLVTFILMRAHIVEPYVRAGIPTHLQQRMHELSIKINKTSRILQKELPGILKRLPNINVRDVYNGRTLLFIVQSKDLAKILLDAGISINAQDNDGETALFNLVLMLSSVKKHEEGPETKQLEDLVGYLLQQGADPYIKDKSGKSAFDLAKKGRLSKILSLMKRSSKGKK